MGELPSKDMTDDLVDLLASGERAQAILASYRAGGASLEDAWSTVRQLSIDLGESEEDLPKSAAVDTAFRDVRSYLAPSFWPRRKAQIQVAAVTAIVLVFCCYLFFIHLPPLIADLRSDSWPETDATIVQVRTYTVRRLEQQRVVERDYMDYRFGYDVMGEYFLRRLTRVPYYDIFGEKPYKVGDRITVFYNPAEPGQAVHKRPIYRRSIRLVIAFALLMFGSLGVWYVVSRERALTRLRQFDARR